MSKKFIGMLTLCSLFVLFSSCHNPFHSYYNQFAEKHFLKGCKQMHSQEECQKILANVRATEEYKESTSNNQKLRLIIRKMQDNHFSRAPDKDLKAKYIEQAKDLLRSSLTNPNEFGYRTPMTILMTASACNYHEFIKWLIDNKVDINFTEESYPETALHEASRLGNLESVKVLLDNGADATIKDYSERTALDTANHWGQAEVVKLLSEHMKKNS